MHHSRVENKRIISTAATVIIAVVILAAKYVLSLDIYSLLFTLIGATAVSVVCFKSDIVKRNNYSLPFFFIALIGSCIGVEGGWWQGYTVALLIFTIWSIGLSFHKEEELVWKIFTTMILFAIATLIDGTVIWILPSFIVCLIMFERFTLQNLIAALFGLCTVYASLASVAFITDKFNLLTDYINGILPSFELISLRTVDLITYILTGVYTLISFIVFLSRFNNNGLKFRTTVLFSFSFLLNLILINLFTKHTYNFEPTVLLMLGVLLSWFAENANSKFEKVLFYLYLSLMILTQLCKYFIMVGSI
ncbi:MAG: DUF6427 family protein [Paludibacteraceae bacterium]|nr:DUF6427 family protein [Paludibacteraceae bacterium]